MHFVDFEGTNFAFTKPEDMTDQQCRTLRVKRGMTEIDGEKYPVSTSGWKPTAEDLERLNAGGLIYLNIFGLGHPPVSVSTELIETEPLSTRTEAVQS
jgi:hypothetical protein